MRCLNNGLKWALYKYGIFIHSFIHMIELTYCYEDLKQIGVDLAELFQYIEI
jgi:hypothetical protein